MLNLKSAWNIEEIKNHLKLYENNPDLIPLGGKTVEECIESSCIAKPDYNTYRRRLHVLIDAFIQMNKDFAISYTTISCRLMYPDVYAKAKFINDGSYTNNSVRMLMGVDGIPYITVECRDFGTLHYGNITTIIHILENYDNILIMIPLYETVEEYFRWIDEQKMLFSIR